MSRCVNRIWQSFALCVLVCMLRLAVRFPAVICPIRSARPVGSTILFRAKRLGETIAG